MSSIYDNNFWETLGDLFTGGYVTGKKATKAIQNAGDEYSQSLKDIAANTKGAKELYQAGKEAASSAANNKAGIAKRNAKAAAMQGGGSRLMAAIQGAQGAVDASTDGYDSAASNYAALEGNVQSQKNAALQNAAAAKYQSTVDAATNQANAAANRSKFLQQTGSAISNIVNSKNKKESE